ncbi:MAG: PIG-L family deacetylase [Armatimonadetes bacterium]|nr:PIG-L family deacetylase [Armatimonadota bacterium]
MAVAAHPDDIEFMMAGTLILLGKVGYELHYMNIANGSCGSTTLPREEIARIRTREAHDAADLIGAIYREPLVDDLMIFYDEGLVRKLCSIVREVKPQVLLLPSPQDYMEDHMNASRLMVTASFCRNVPNFATNPPIPPIYEDIAVYHAMPYGLCDQLRQPIIPEIYIDISDVMDEKREALACHNSQKEWLDQTHGLDSYLNTMVEMSAEVGRMSGRFVYAEGWRRHSHLGFGPKDFDPLRDALRETVISA